MFSAALFAVVRVRAALGMVARVEGGGIGHKREKREKLMGTNNSVVIVGVGRGGRRYSWG